jgi:hypothetical protein
MIKPLQEAVGQAHYLARVLRDHIRLGRAHHGVVGDAETMLIEVRDIMSFGGVAENLAPH